MTIHRNDRERGRRSRKNSWGNNVRPGDVAREVASKISESAFLLGLSARTDSNEHQNGRDSKCQPHLSSLLVEARRRQIVTSTPNTARGRLDYSTTNCAATPAWSEGQSPEAVR